MYDGLDMPTVQKRGNSLHVSHGSDESAIVSFEMEWIPDEEGTRDKGKLQGRQVPFVEIRFPNDRTKIIKKPVDDEIKARFPRQWAHFEKTGKPSLDGFPIEQVPSFTRGDVQMFKGNNIHTLEQLANITDANLPGMWRKYRDVARGLLKTAEDSAAATKAEQENSELKSRISDLEEQIKRLAAKKAKE